MTESSLEQNSEVVKLSCLFCLQTNMAWAVLPVSNDCNVTGLPSYQTGFVNYAVSTMFIRMAKFCIPIVAIFSYSLLSESSVNIVLIILQLK